jgi:hypothetical protein
MKARAPGRSESFEGWSREANRRRMDKKQPETQHGGDSSLNPANSDCLELKRTDWPLISGAGRAFAQQSCNGRNRTS